ncbi:MAG: hypothetical protein PVJ57_08840 [Phycisphaerae bacterium]|jgi:hypothetical protein
MRRITGILAVAALMLPALAFGDVLSPSYDNVDEWNVSLAAGDGTRADPVWIYDNNNMTGDDGVPVASVNSYDVTSLWGDEVRTEGTGVLRSFSFFVCNPSPMFNQVIANCTFDINFYDYNNRDYIGGFSLATTGAVLGGHTARVTLSDIDQAFTIDLTGHDHLFVTEQITAYEGNAVGVGALTRYPPNIGSSDRDEWYWSGTDSTVFPNGPGWYSFSTATYNMLSFAIGVTPEPGSLLLLGMAGLLIRRR